MLVQICFTIDCTSSMGPWIHAVKTQTEDMIRSLRHEHRDADFEVGIVCYRDYGDREQFKIVDFTHNIPRVSNEIRNIQAEGGSDDAEDVARGLFNTWQALKWDSEADVRMVFHIADAPAHGMRYHSAEVSDKFPYGDPQGINPEETMRGMASQGIDYTFIKITSATDIMIRKFAEAYEGHHARFMVTDLTPQQARREFGTRTPSDALSPIVIRSVTQRISSQDPKEGLYNPTQTTDSQNQESSTSP